MGNGEANRDEGNGGEEKGRKKGFFLSPCLDVYEGESNGRGRGELVDNISFSGIHH